MVFWFQAAAAVIIGCIVGSFVALVADRWPRGEPIALARSRCRDCGRALAAYDLVPVLSYCVQRASCRTCHASLPVDLLLAELAGGAVAFVALTTAPNPAGGVALALFGWSLLLLALLDARHMWLPDTMTLPLGLTGIASFIVLPSPTFAERLAGAAAGYASLALLRWAYRRLRGREGLGGGDAKLLAAVGAWLGIAALPGVVLGAAMLGLAFAAIRKLSGQPMDGTTALPLGTMLAIAAIAAIAVLPFTG